MIGERFPDPSRDPRDQVKEIVKQNGWRFLLACATLAVEKLTSIFEHRSYKTYYFIMIDDKLMGDNQLREEWVLFSKRVEKSGVIFVHPYEENGDFGKQILSGKSWHIKDKKKIENNIASIMILEDQYNEFDPKKNRHFFIKMDDYISETGSTLVFELNRLFDFLESAIANRKDLNSYPANAASTTWRGARRFRVAPLVLSPATSCL